MVFKLAQHQASRRITAWLALFLYWFASFTLEYAVGMWPHCIAVMLCTGAVLLVHGGADKASAWRAGVAGLLIGLATGVRYQEILFGGFLGVTLLYWSMARPSAGPTAAPELSCRTRAVRLSL